MAGNWKSKVCSMLIMKLLYFEWSSPWHFKVYILTFVPLRSGTAHTDIWHSQLRSGSAHWDLELAMDDAEEECSSALTKSRDPHLAGGEKRLLYCLCWKSYLPRSLFNMHRSRSIPAATQRQEHITSRQNLMNWSCPYLSSKHSGLCTVGIINPEHNCAARWQTAKYQGTRRKGLESQLWWSGRLWPQDRINQQWMWPSLYKSMTFSPSLGCSFFFLKLSWHSS